jgi:hypothetical protein
MWLAAAEDKAGRHDYVIRNAPRINIYTTNFDFARIVHQGLA